jgi:hypothetical protein
MSVPGDATSVDRRSLGVPPVFATPSVHDEIAQGLRDHPAKKGLRFNLFVTGVEIGGSIALFHLARSVGASDVGSYLAGSIAPILGALMIWAKARKFSGASAAIFTFTIVSAAIALAGSTTPKVLLYKDCAATALIGLVFLGSCVVARKPVVFYLAQRYGTDGTREGMSIFDTMWDTYDGFRQAMYVTSYLWAALFLVQASATALIIREVSYPTAYNYNQVLPFVATALGIVGSIAIGRYFTKRGTAQAALANAAGSEPA